MCYILRRGCSYTVAIYITPANNYAILWPSATFYLTAIAIYQMPHFPHISLGLRCCHLLQYSLHFGYSAYRCICFPIILFYRSEIYLSIVTLSSTMPSVLHIFHWLIISLQCFFLLIRIVTIISVIPINITGSHVKPTMPSVLHNLRSSMIGLWFFCLLIPIHIVPFLALIPFDIAGSQVLPLEFSCTPSSLDGGRDGIALITFVTFIFVLSAAPWHPEI